MLSSNEQIIDDESFDFDNVLKQLSVPRQKATSGRKPVPIKEYLQSRKQRIDNLKLLANNKQLPVKERKRWRAQLFALKRRLNEKIKNSV